MRKIKDLCVVTRTYTQNGQDKKVWKNVGAIYVNDDGQERIAIDAFFNFSALRQDNSDRVWLAAFTPKPKEQQQDNSSHSYEGTHGFQPYDEAQGFDSNATLPEGSIPF